MSHAYELLTWWWYAAEDDPPPDPSDTVLQLTTLQGGDNA